jgi:serine/threonine protein kinase
MAISHYRILNEIGQGQFGQVYSGSDRTTGELVALKKLDLRRSPTKRFLNELAILSKLEHPNIVQIKGLAYEKKERYLVTNYCQGGTLRHLMTPKIRPTLIQKLNIIRDVLLGLEHIHLHKIIHCDLKPENILLNVSAQGWNAQIADFGVAHWQEVGPAKQQRLGDTGSPAYMAPERFYSQYSPASDIYAVGVILYELLLGRRPFSGMPGEIMKAHFHQRVKVPKTLPFQLKIILKTSLHKLPQQRYGSAEQMRFAMEAAIADIEHRQNQGDIIAEPILHSELAASQRTSIQGETLGDRIAARPATPVDPSQLPLEQTIDGSIHQLWTTSEQCFGLLQHQGSLEIARWSLSEKTQFLTWALPSSATKLLDINSSGTWLTCIQSDQKSTQEQPCTLQTISLNTFTPHHPIEIPQTPEKIWMLNSRHLLVTVQTESPSHHSLQLWNRRGQVYWAYEVPFQIRNLATVLGDEDQIVAIVEGSTHAGVWIDLKPFRVKRFALPQSADWICSAPWGYVIANRTGAITCLNRRGRTIAKLSLNLTETQTIQGISLLNLDNLWIAIEDRQNSQIISLDLNAHLPKRMIAL